MPVSVYAFFFHHSCCPPFQTLPATPSLSPKLIRKEELCTDEGGMSLMVSKSKSEDENKTRQEANAVDEIEWEADLYPSSMTVTRPKLLIPWTGCCCDSMTFEIRN